MFASLADGVVKCSRILLVVSVAATGAVVV